MQSTIQKQRYSLVLGLSLCLTAGSIGWAQQQPAATNISEASLTDAQVAETVVNLGATVKTEGDAPNGAITEIVFDYTHTKKTTPAGTTIPPYAVTDDLVGRIAKLPKLTSLELNMCSDVTDVGVGYLKAAPQLRHLALSWTKLSDAGMATIGGLTQLQYLRTSGCGKVTAAGWTNLQNLKQLETLWVGETTIGDKGVANLAGLTQLRDITFYGTPVTDAGAQVLKGLPSLTSVRCGPKMTPAEVAELHAALPNCRFWR